MFWKVLGGIVAFFMAVLLVVVLLAAAGVTALGVAVGSAIDNLDVRTVEVTDASGNTETYDVNDLFAESGRVEVTGKDGERVTIDLNLPQITVQDSGEESARVIIDGQPRFEFNSDVPHVRIDGRSWDNFDGSFIARPIVGFFRALFNLTVLTLIAVGIWMVLRNRRPEANVPQEKTPNATA